MAPMGKWLTCPNRLSSFNWDRSSVLPDICTCQPLPIDPMGNSLTCSPRLTLAQLLSCFGQLQGVCATETLHSSHRPDGKMADVLASTHACTTVDASVNYRGYVPQRPCKVPMALMGKLLTCLPRLTLAQLCERFGQLQLVLATETLKTSHHPMGKWLTCLPRLTLAQLQTLRSTIQGVRAAETLKTSHRPNGKIANVLALTLACTTSVNFSKYVPQRPASIPSSRWETHVLLVVCRAAVSGSRVAQWPSHHAPSVGTQLLMCLLLLKSSHPPWETHVLLLVCRAAVSTSSPALSR
jgi:hypothetical protein